MASDSTCQQLTAQYRHQSQLLEQARTFQGSYLHQNSVSDLESAITLLTALNDEHATFNQQYKQAVIDMLSVWSPNLPIADRIRFIDGRVHVDGDLDLLDDEWPINYMPSLIQKINGHLRLPVSLTSIDFIEELDGVSVGRNLNPNIINKNFSAKQLKRAKVSQYFAIDLDNINGEINLPMLTSAGYIFAQQATVFNAPKLASATEVKINGKANLDELIHVGFLYLEKDTQLKITKAVEIDSVSVRETAGFSAENLERVTGIIVVKGLPKGRSFQDCFPDLKYVAREIYTDQPRIKKEVEQLRQTKALQAQECELINLI